jgi:hypothetical protein
MSDLRVWRRCCVCCCWSRAHSSTVRRVTPNSSLKTISPCRCGRRRHRAAVAAVAVVVKRRQRRGVRCRKRRWRRLLRRGQSRSRAGCATWAAQPSTTRAPTSYPPRPKTPLYCPAHPSHSWSCSATSSTAPNVRSVSYHFLLLPLLLQRQRRRRRRHRR